MLTLQKKQPRSLSQLKKVTLEHIDFPAYYRRHLGNIGAADKNGNVLTICPFHEDKNPSLSINIRTGLFKCHGCHVSGDIYNFTMKLKEVDFTAAVSDLAQFAGIKANVPKQQSTMTKTYDYTDQSGELIFQVCRYEPKKFSQRHPDGKKGWIWNLKNIEVIPYRLQQLTNADKVFICEGEKDCDQLNELGMIATCNPMGAGKWRQSFNHYFAGKDVIILPDNDDPGRKHAQSIADNLVLIAKSVKIINLPNLSIKGDVSDWLDAGNTKVDLIQLTQTALEYTSEEQGLKAISLRDFLSLKLPPRTNILSPWLPSQGICLIHAYRGVGKTHIALGVGCAVGSGGNFLKWDAPEPVGVLVVDGEMPSTLLQERLSQIIVGMDIDKASVDILTPDLQKNGMPDIATQEGQLAIEQLITPDIKLIIFDNISTLVRSGRENEADGWLPVQSWALKLRAQGKSILFIHHSGKQGNQRGTSKREDILDTVISLRHPPGYSPEEGACFEIHFEKTRGIFGDEVKPFEARLMTGKDGSAVWTTKPIEDSKHSKIVQLHKDGLSQTEIAQELEIHKSNVSRHIKKARLDGELK